MKKYDELREALEASIPRNQIASRSAGGGKTLDYLETWRAIDIANEIFGNTGWNHEIRDLTLLPSEGKPAYRCTVRVTAFVSTDHGVMQVVHDGVGYGIDKSGLNPHEMAVKEAESDALKRALMKFGKRVGLALYDKTQEFVTDDNEPKAKKEEAKPAAKSNVTVKDQLRAAANFLITKGSLDKPTFVKDFLSPAKAAKIDDLTEDQANKVYNHLVLKHKELSTNQ